MSCSDCKVTETPSVISSALSQEQRVLNCGHQNTIFLISCFIAVELTVKCGHNFGEINCYGIEEQKPQWIFDMSHK